MSLLLIKKSNLRNTILQNSIRIPSSKSHTLRAILFASLADGISTIRGYLPSPDTQAMIHACELMGARIEITENTLKIHGVNGKIEQVEDVIDAGNSGIVLRFCAAVGSLCHHPVVITGDHSIRHRRPMKPLLSGLSQLGVSVKSMRGDGFAPIIIQGPLHNGRATIHGEDSQYVSAMLIAAAFVKGSTYIDVINPGETPWISLTLDWFDRLSIAYENINFSHYRMKGNAYFKGFDYTVPGDLSSAAFPLAAALITQSELLIHNVDMNDIQGDKVLISILQRMGANLVIDEKHKTLEVKKGSVLRGISIDINSCIDCITVLAAIACYAEGKTHLYNGAIAKHKECDRIQCIASELRKMGANIEETEDGLIIEKSLLIGTRVSSFNDHRMVMSLAVAGLGAGGTTIIDDIKCIAKTYPTFVEDFKAIGASIEVSPCI